MTYPRSKPQPIIEKWMSMSQQTGSRHMLDLKTRTVQMINDKHSESISKQYYVPLPAHSGSLLDVSLTP